MVKDWVLGRSITDIIVAARSALASSSYDCMRYRRLGYSMYNREADILYDISQQETAQLHGGKTVITTAIFQGQSYDLRH